MADESFWVEKAQSAEARLSTAQAQIDPLKEKIRGLKEMFGAKEKSDGSFDIDYTKFVGMLGPAGALEVRRVIDEMYGISGNAGEKPRIRARAA